MPMSFFLYIRTVHSNFLLFLLADKHTDLSVRENLEDSCLRDSISIASTDSFVSAAEVREKGILLSREPKIPKAFGDTIG